MATQKTRPVTMAEKIAALRETAQHIVAMANRRCACDGEWQCGFHAEVILQFAEDMDKLLASMDYADADAPTAAAAAAWRN